MEQFSELWQLPNDEHPDGRMLLRMNGFLPVLPPGSTVEFGMDTWTVKGVSLEVEEDGSGAALMYRLV